MAGLVLGLGLLTAGCGAATVPASTAPAASAGVSSPGGMRGLTRTNDAAQVTVEVTPAAAPAPGAVLSFEVVMDTHSVDLDGYDLSRLAVLRVDGGKEVPPSAWSAPKGGHHREGTLAFPAIAPGSKSVVLIIKDVAAVAERSFTWTL